MRKLLLFIVFSLFIAAHSSSAQGVVISEIYGGGGNSGATYKNDFIELYNPTGSAINLTGWSVQYASSTGTTWQATNLSGSIAAKGYYLIQEAAGTGGTLSLPTPNATGTINMSGTTGKVALVSSTTLLSGASPVSASIVDLVGFGTATFFEGSVAPAPSNTNSIERKANSSSTSTSMQPGGADEFLGNGYDSNNNGSDFVTRLPQPQNSLSGFEPDTTAPSFTSGYPKTANLTDIQFDLVVNLNESGKAYYVVLADTTIMLTSAQVKAGQDNGGNAVSNSGIISVTSNGADFSKSISGLTQNTNYHLFVAAEDLAGNLQGAPALISVKTKVSIAPTISPSVSTITFTGFTDKSKQSASQSYTINASNLTANVNLSVSGNFLISLNDSTYSTALSINSANFSSSKTVYVKFNPSGNTGTQTGTITHSTSGATSKFVTLSAVAIDPYNQNFNDPAVLTNSGWTQYSKVGAQTWGSTNFGRSCLTGCNAATPDKAVQMNGYSGGAQNNEDWLISPLMDLTTFTNYPSLSFWTISAFAGNQLQLKYSSDYTGSGDPALATWITIDGKFPASNSSAWTNSSNIILPKSAIRVAFVYTSNTAAASRWTVDDWQVSDVSSFLNVSNINFSFGEVLAGSHSASRSFSFNAIGYGNITVTAPSGFEVSSNNSTFASSIIVSDSSAANGDSVYVRFAPASKQLKWTGSIGFSGNGLASSYGTVAGSSYPKAETFNIATYNLEFFGTDVKDATGVEFGPTDDALQVSNATKVLQTVGADIIGVEEISDDNAFNQLVSNLPGYNKVVSNRWSYSWQAPDPNYPPQKTGFIYNTSKVQLVSSRVMFASMYDSILAGTKTLANYPTGTSSSFWSSGRLPFMATFDVTVNGVTQRVRMIDIHGKSASDQTSYNRRVYDAKVLRDSLNAYYPHDNIILVGDYNDQVYGSITTGVVSSYKTFVDDATNFTAITYDLNVSGASTFPNSASFIDNMIISNELVNSLVNNSVTVEDPRSYISNYVTTTSDHLPVSARFMLAKMNQTITFDTLANKTFGDAPFNLNATASSGLTVTYASSDSTIASISSNMVTIHKAGTVNITASQIGNSTYNAADALVRSLKINKANQSITFDSLTAKTFGDAPFSLHATSSSGLPVAFTCSDSTVVSILGDTVIIHKAGTVNITARQSGNESFNAAADVIQVLVINKANQTISFDSLTAKTFGDAPFSLHATSSSGLPVAFTCSDSTVVSILGDTVIIHKAGTVNVTARQSGNESFNAAADVMQVLVINKANQSITFDSLAARTFGDAPFSLHATSSSGLPVAFTSSDSTVVSILGDSVIIHKAGTVNIRARQSGNQNFNAAIDVIRQLNIDKANQTITFNTLATKTFGDANFALSATSTSGLPITYTVPDSSIVSINGSTVTILRAGTVNITASQAGNGYYNPASSVTRTLTINKANQTITFNALGTKTTSDPDFALTATSTSGLPIFYTSSDSSIASINENIVTIHKAGTVIITASQPGNLNYNAASSVQQPLTINTGNIPLVYVISPADGATNVSVSLTITAKTLTGAKTYTIEISPSSTFAKGVISKSGKSSQNFTGLAYGTKYYARVKTNLSPNYGKTTSFTTLSVSSLCYITSPVNGSVNVPYITNVTANVIPNAAVYTIELNTDSLFLRGTSIVKSSSSATIAFTLAFNTKYFARVMTNLENVWGTNIRSFTTGIPVGPAYVTSPKNGSTGVPTTITVSSNSVHNATSYTIELNTSPNFKGTSIVKTSKTRDITFSALASNQTYYTRVQTNVNPGLWGVSTSFTTASHSARTAANTNEKKDQVESGFTAKVYPIPFKDILTVHVQTDTQEEVSIQIWDLNGMEAARYLNKSNSTIELQLNGLSSGLYIMKIVSSEGIEVKKIIKE